MAGSLHALGVALKGLLKTLGLLLAGLVVLAVLSLLSDRPLETFFRLLSLAGTTMMLLSVVGMLATFRQARQLEPVALLLSLAVSLASTLLSLALAEDLPPTWLLFGGLAAGVAAGVLWARTTLLYVDGSEVRGRGTLWSLAIWAVSFAASQLTLAIGGGSGTVATTMLLASAGLAAGNTLCLAWRVRRVRTTVPSA